MLAWHLGLRYLRKRRAAWLAVVAVMLTVAAPVAVTGVTQGFIDLLQRQARASESDITWQPPYFYGGAADVPANREAITGAPGVVAIAPFVQCFALAMTVRGGGDRASYIVPCQIDGVAWDADVDIGRIDAGHLHPPPAEDLRPTAPRLSPEQRGSGFITQRWRAQLCVDGLDLVAGLGLGPLPLPPRQRPPPGVVAGRELLYGSGLMVRQPIDLVGPAQRRQLVEISDTIGTGIYEYDRMAMVTPLPVAQSLQDYLHPARDAGFPGLGPAPARVDGWRIRAQPQSDLNQLAATIEQRAGSRAETWYERRRNMVRSLEYQRNLMAVVMIAIQLIAVFVIYASFSTMVAEKRHDLGVLLGLGARPGDIIRAFLIAGLATCLIGGVLGWALGWFLLGGLILLSEKCGILLFPQDVFYSAEPPVSWNPLIPLIFIGAMSVVGLLAATIPAWRAGYIDPVDILKESG
jgi:ABC-type lipoprotein release transport system permease subunit